ncbi:endonuclease/exonuclease/phosphatase family protein [Mucilaginibacter sp. PAMB04274]|uniref:endonuclease/exonuclease/phosphatase family protein n=1 Tax=Mucilaginibacter sp. PAMB04274 TaxID=3138568 RepID=UPI0031F6FFFD
MKVRFFMQLLLLLTLVTGMLHAQTLTVATYNLRFDNPRDTGNLWVNRAPVVAALIRFHNFDIFGTQEALKNQLDDVATALPQYQRYGVGRDDGSDKGEHSAIFFRKDKFKLLNKGDFWLSQTPEKPSLGWDATCCNRICSWVYLQDVTSKKRFYFFNVHYDHQGMVAREESSKLILQKIKAIAGSATAILTGDFNGDHNSSWYKRIATSDLLKDTYQQVKYPYFNNGSFNGFGASLKNNEIIDHIFTTVNVLVNRWGVITDSYHGKFPSDHFPVMAEITFK